MPVDMNQTIKEASLDNLNDIIVPEAVGFFPLSPGWVLVGIVCLTLCFHWLIKGYQKYQKSRYKREAIKELATLNLDTKQSAMDALDLAKRVAIVTYGRQTVAHLSGEAWWDFMQNHSNVKVNDTLRSKVATLFYDEQSTQEIDVAEIKSLVKMWIDTHKETKDV